MELGGFLIKFWSISDQFWSKISQILRFWAISADFCRFRQISAHFGSSSPASAGHEGTASAGRCRGRPHPRKGKENQWFFDVSRGAGRARRARPAGHLRGPRSISARNLQILADFSTFLHISVYFWAEIRSILAHFWSFPSNSLNFIIWSFLMNKLINFNGNLWN